MDFDLKKKDEEKAAILGLEMIITDKTDNSQTPVYGEIAICDSICSLYNQNKPQSQHAIRLGQDLNFDNYVQKLSYGLKSLIEQSVIHKNPDVKD